MKATYETSQEAGFTVVRARLFGRVIATERVMFTTKEAAKKALEDCKKRVEHLKNQARL